MAHWKLTPKQLNELSEEDIELMVFSHRLYEKRGIESLSDLIGTLTGTSWPVESLTAGPEEELEESLKYGGFTWKLRPPRQRVSLPLTLVVGGNKVLEHVKKAAFSMKDKSDSSIVSLPNASFLKGAQVVELGKLPKEQFLKYARHAKGK